MKKKISILIISFLAVSLFFIMPNSITVSAKEKVTSGQDANGNKWVYDEVTKTLTFSGTTMIEKVDMNGHDPEPEWWCWRWEAEHLVIESGITGLEGGEFDTFNKLKTLELPDTVTYIGDDTFNCCFEIEAISIPKNVTYIGDGAFSDCRSWQNISIPDKVTFIGSGAFGGCEKLVNLEIPNSVTKIGKYAFADCENLVSIKLPENLKVIDEQVFRNCKKLSEVKLPESVEKIKIGAFMGSGLTKIVIPKNVTSFYKKKGMYGKDGIFQDCKKLKLIEIKSKKLNNVYKYALTGIKKNVIIKVPKSKLKKYKKLFAKGGLNKKVKVKDKTGQL